MLNGVTEEGQPMEEIGKKIREIREKEGETLRLTAESIGISHAHLSKIENGKNTPSLEGLEKLAEHFGVPVGYLLGEEKSLEEYERIKNLQFINDIDLLNAVEIMNKYDVKMFGKEITERELKAFIAWMKSLREEV